LNKYLKYIVKGLILFIAVFILVYVAVYGYVAINKKSIIGKIVQQVHDKLNGQVEIGDISVGFLSTFPHISVSLEDVSVRDTLFNQHHHPFFNGKKVYLNLSITSIVKGNSPVNGVLMENSQLYVYTDSSGYTNKYLFTPKQDIKSATETTSSFFNLNSFRNLSQNLLYAPILPTQITFILFKTFTQVLSVLENAT